MVQCKAHNHKYYNQRIGRGRMKVIREETIIAPVRIDAKTDLRAGNYRAQFSVHRTSYYQGFETVSTTIGEVRLAILGEELCGLSLAMPQSV
jgi:hypothetical protein